MSGQQTLCRAIAVASRIVHGALHFAPDVFRRVESPLRGWLDSGRMRSLPDGVCIKLLISPSAAFLVWQQPFRLLRASAQKLLHPSQISNRSWRLRSHQREPDLTIAASRTLWEICSRHHPSRPALNQPSRRPRKKPLFVVFCLMLAVSPSSAALA